MTDQQTQQDTPMEQANINDGFQEVAPLTEDSSNNLSVEDAFFGSQEEAPAEGQPSTEETIQQPEQTNPSNDEKRFEYWQSRADKLQNELNQVQQAPVQPQAPPVNEPSPAPTMEEFPPPPDRPARPRSYSRSEAYSDPDSESARYLDAQDDWRAEMDEYNSLKSEFQSAVVQERVEAIEKNRQDEVRKREAFTQQQRQAQEIDQYVQGHYGLSSDESKQFMQEMSDPKSLSMDNLVQLWRMKNSAGNTQNPSSQEPSAAFQQTANAQQVPSPMGVMPSTGGETNKSAEDQIMDNMLIKYKKNNPW
tara:strand:+ start:6235 stop:7152 length:918 start_codon:yes stop_codon:yes gene_type:complete